MDYYNNRRPHSYNNGLTPAAAENKLNLLSGNTWPLQIELSGFEVKSSEHPEGDIEIIFTGLRPGEKLFEELLIGDSVTGTEHPKILRANEIFVEEGIVAEALSQVEEAENCLDAESARSILQSVAGGFKPNSALVDLLDKKTV